MFQQQVLFLLPLMLWSLHTIEKFGESGVIQHHSEMIIQLLFFTTCDYSDLKGREIWMFGTKNYSSDDHVKSQ